MKLLFSVGMISFVICCNSSGVDSEVSRKLVYNGWEVHPKHRYPWMAQLQNEDVKWPTTNQHNCGGSLIHPRVVLTAAHCKSDGDKDFPEIGHRIYLGMHDYIEDMDKVEDVKLLNFALSGTDPKYDDVPDTMLLLLDRPVKKSKPVKIGKCDDLTSKDEVTFLGWGLWDQDITQAAIDAGRCAQAPLGECNPLKLQEGNSLFAGYLTRGGDGCEGYKMNHGFCFAEYGMTKDLPFPGKGDSGGPVFLKGRGPHDDLLCGIYSRLDYRGSYAVHVEGVYEWIRSIMEDEWKLEAPKLYSRPPHFHRHHPLMIAGASLTMLSVLAGVVLYTKKQRNVIPMAHAADQPTKGPIVTIDLPMPSVA